VKDGSEHGGSLPRASGAEAVANALGSVGGEGLDPGRAEQLLAAWGRGELTDEQLDEIRRRMLHERELTAEELLASVRVA
jgi:hypothetical protein